MRVITMEVPTDRPVTTTRTQRIGLGDDGVVRAIYIPGSDTSLEDAKANIAADVRVAAAGGAARCRLLVDYSGLRGIARDARVYLASAETARLVLAAALVVRSPLERTVGNFFLGLNKPVYPTRMFAHELEAAAWLKECAG